MYVTSTLYIVIYLLLLVIIVIIGLNNFYLSVYQIITLWKYILLFHAVENHFVKLTFLKVGSHSRMLQY
jgi:hypothetical protein